MKLDSERYEEIDKEVIRMFSRIRIKSFPVDCFDVCKQLGFKVYTYAEVKGTAKEALLNASKDGCNCLIEWSKGVFEKELFNMGDFFDGKDERTVDGSRYVRYLDMSKWYSIVVPKDNSAYDEMCDYKIWDEEKSDIKDIYWFMKFHEDTYLLMEKYLFNFIDAECNLLINMYEEEWIEGDNLQKVLKITERMIGNSDNEEFIKLANEFYKLVEKAIENDTCVGCYF